MLKQQEEKQTSSFAEVKTTHSHRVSYSLHPMSLLRTYHAHEGNDPQPCGNCRCRSLLPFPPRKMSSRRTSHWLEKWQPRCEARNWIRRPYMRESIRGIRAEMKLFQIPILISCLHKARELFISWERFSSSCRQ